MSRAPGEDDRLRDVEERLRLKTEQYAQLECEVETQLRADVAEREALDRVIGQLLIHGLPASPEQVAREVAELQQRLQQAERELALLRQARSADESRLSYQLLVGTWRIASRVIPPHSGRSAVLRGFTWPIKAALRASRR